MEVSGELHVPVALPPGKGSLDRRLGGPQSPSGRREGKILDPNGFELLSLCFRAHSQSLYRLLEGWVNVGKRPRKMYKDIVGSEVLTAVIVKSPYIVGYKVA
jgi:hypothetical protein